MRRMMILALCFGFRMAGFSADGPETLLRIGGKAVPADEFEYYCRHQPELDGLGGREECLDRFILFKLKVAEAEALGWDTLPSFRQQCKVAQGEVWKNVLLDSGKEEDACRAAYFREMERMGNRAAVRMSHITLFLPQDASVSREAKAGATMDSIYAALKQGASFEELAGEYADSSSSFLKMSPEVWTNVVAFPKEIADRLQDMKAGEFSKPFFSPLGIHIVRLLEYKSCPSYEEMRPGLSACLWRLGAGHPALKPEAYQCWKEGKCPGREVDLRLNAVRDRLLSGYWDKADAASDAGLVSPEELEAYFKKHKARYAWEFPHFKGAVIHCMNKKTASRIKKRLKRKPLECWKEVFEHLMKEHPECQAELETGLFQIGTNPYVDRLAFKCGDLPRHEKYPYSCVAGKILKKGPEDYRDVRQTVEADWRQAAREKRLEDLKARFKVEVCQDVLKTVNCGRNK